MYKEASLVQQLLNPKCYDHPVEHVELIETHISWIFLAGAYAYKLKKPVSLGFLDFSNLDKRRFYCFEELRLNRAFSPELYLDVVPVGGPIKNVRIGQTPALDYLVKMNRFDQYDQLDKRLENNRLTATQLKSFAQKIATLHQQAEIAPKISRFGNIEEISQPVQTNFKQIRKILLNDQFKDILDALESWSLETTQQLKPFFAKRKLTEHIRACHGDLHLRNMAWIDNQPVLFDCIEFNPSLRIIDTINDIAFLTMDLDVRGQNFFSWVFLDAYMQHSGDFNGLTGLRFYQVYRAMVRAKVAAIQLSQNQQEKQQPLLDLLSSYLHLAMTYIKTPKAQLILTHGLSGSGKSTFVNKLAPHIGALCLHSDRERKRSPASMNTDLYTSRAREKTYTQLAQHTENMLMQGINVIVDATFTRKQDRQIFQRIADKERRPLTILDFQLSEQTLRNRLRHRSTSTAELSDADEKVLDLQLTHAEPLSQAEKQKSIVITETTSIEDLVRILCP
jgi:aminoglycoside phosphotransferase family enzyme/predicted kinase